jgi:hypothetical protein
VAFRGRAVQVDLLDDLTAEHRRDVVDARDVEPFEYRGRTQDLPNGSRMANADGRQNPSGLPNGSVDHHVVCAYRIQTGLLRLEPCPHPLGIVDAEIARENE